MVKSDEAIYKKLQELAVNGQVKITYEQIQQGLPYSYMTVRRSIQRLVKHGLISRKKERLNPLDQTYTYNILKQEELGTMTYEDLEQHFSQEPEKEEVNSIELDDDDNEEPVFTEEEIRKLIEWQEKRYEQFDASSSFSYPQFYTDGQVNFIPLKNQSGSQSEQMGLMGSEQIAVSEGREHLGKNPLVPPLTIPPIIPRFPELNPTLAFNQIQSLGGRLTELDLINHLTSFGDCTGFSFSLNPQVSKISTTLGGIEGGPRGEFNQLSTQLFELNSENFPQSTQLIEFEPKSFPHSTKSFPQSVNNFLTQETKKAKRPKKADFLDEIIQDFQGLYQEILEREYVITSRGKERSAVGKLFKLFAKKEKPRLELMRFLRDCLEIAQKDKFYNSRITLPLILSQFNTFNGLVQEKRDKEIYY